MAYVLAGGRGSRLKELTDRRAKPAVYFGGKVRIIDFALSNALNSGIRRIGVATQYKAHSLIRHLQRGWDFLRPERNESFDILPASQRVSETQWYEGTADAVYQNLDIIADYEPEFMVILAGDHIYKMDYELMLQQHVDQGADVTVGCLEVPRMEAVGFGVMHVDEKDMITAFVEKPADPPGIPGQPDMALASMGIYVFRTKFLADLLRRDADDPRLEPRLRQGPDPLRRPARQGGRPPLRRILRALHRGIDRLLARRRHRRRLLGGQHRPHRHHPRARPLRHKLADLDLRRDQAAGEVRPRRGRPPRQRRVEPRRRRLHHLRRARCAARWSPPAAACTPSPASTRRCCCPTATSAARRGSGASSSTVVSASPRGWWSARIPSSTPALPPHRVRHLPDHPADDRPPALMRDPVGRLRGLPADQDGRPRRRRRRPAAGAGPPRHRDAHARCPATGR